MPTPTQPQPATAGPTPCTANTLAQFVLVSISDQRAWMCAAGHQVYTTLVTTGADADGMGTPTGTWYVQDKQTDRYLVGVGYRDWVKYWIPFNGDYGFHDASWQTVPFGSNGYHSGGSHGCVHLPTAAMAWIYNWVTVGAEVTVEA
jgi:lipoprotein-anchoring transpeptidase ErfK/SrfK